MRNCLTLSISYRIKNKHSKIRFQNPPILNGILEFFESGVVYDIKKLFEYLSYMKTELGGYMNMVRPHFFIEHGDYEIHFESHRIKRYRL